jgi:hypothetical protein
LSCCKAFQLTLHAPGVQRLAGAHPRLPLSRAERHYAEHVAC